MSVKKFPRANLILAVIGRAQSDKFHEISYVLQIHTTDSGIHFDLHC